ncbi:MAG: hypothetical protein ABI865_15700, partial [Nitrosospira sp.]
QRRQRRKRPCRGEPQRAAREPREEAVGVRDAELLGEEPDDGQVEVAHALHAKAHAEPVDDDGVDCCRRLTYDPAAATSSFNSRTLKD